MTFATVQELDAHLSEPTPAVVLQGFPGTLASFWQQAGRAGRALQPSAAVLVAGDDQLDRWYLDHPTQLFSRSLEPAVINPRNPFVAEPHAGCAISAARSNVSPTSRTTSTEPARSARDAARRARQLPRKRTVQRPLLVSSVCHSLQVVRRR